MSNDAQQISALAVGKSEAARITGLSQSTIDNLRRAGRLRACKIGAGAKSRVIFDVRELQRFLTENAERPAEVMA
jgi:Helix-turn-helix domain